MIVNATYTSVWDGGTHISSPCKYDMEARRCFDIESACDGGDLDILETGPSSVPTRASHSTTERMMCMKEVVFWFTMEGPRLKQAISLMIQSAAILIAGKMKLHIDIMETDIGVRVPVARAPRFIDELEEAGVPLFLCGIVDCPSQPVATRIEQRGFECEIIL